MDGHAVDIAGGEERIFRCGHPVFGRVATEWQRGTNSGCCPNEDRQTKLTLQIHSMAAVIESDCSQTRQVKPAKVLISMVPPPTVLNEMLGNVEPAASFIAVAMG